MKKFILYSVTFGIGVLSNYLVSKAIDPSTDFFDVVRSSVNFLDPYMDTKFQMVQIDGKSKKISLETAIKPSLIS